MTLSDLLVSYKQVETPKQSEAPIELPTSRYKRLLELMESRQKSDTQTDDQSDTSENQETESGFVGWEYTPSASSTTTSSTTSTPSTTDRVTQRWSSPYKDNKNQWLSDLTAAYKRQGLSDNAIKNLIAKNALESGWGESAQGAYNFGNITTGSAWQGKYVKGKDKDKDGNPITNNFRAYDSLDDYVKDEIQFLTRLYDFNQNDSIDQFLHKLQGGNSGKRHYAGSRTYKSSVKQIYSQL